MDTMFSLIAEENLPVWDGVLAKMQSAGRGAMRNHWISLAGNVFGSLRLPQDYPFTTSAASVALGALCAEGLRGLGFPVRLRWPNDLMLPGNGSFQKAGGILIEERDGALVAGIGINLVAAPTSLDGPLATPAGYLEEIRPAPGAEAFWQELTDRMYEGYERQPPFAQRWLELAESLLLWRGARVRWSDGRNHARGIFCGLSEAGGALLDIGAAIEDKTSGSLRPWGAQL